MKLKSVELKNIAGIKNCKVKFAETGITVIYGPNEIGKSTLANSIDIIFNNFDNTTRQDILALKPVTEDVGPEVALEFSLSDKNYIYRKRFLKNQMTKLEIDGKDVKTGREAHDFMLNELEQYFDMTLFRALRYVQGSSVGNISVNQSPSLLKALDQATQGQFGRIKESETLMDVIRQKYSEYYDTRKKIKPTSELGKQEKELEDLKTKLSKITDDIDQQKALGKQVESVIEEIEDIQKELDQKKIQIEQLKKSQLEIQKKKVELFELISQRKKFESELKELNRQEQQQKLLAERLDNLLNSRKVLEAEIATRDLETQALKKEIQDLIIKVSETEDKLSAANKQRELAQAIKDYQEREISEKLLKQRIDHSKTLKVNLLRPEKF